MKIKPQYSMILSFALIGYGIFYSSIIWDYFYHIHLAASIHPENLRYCFPRTFNEISDYLPIYIPTLFLIAGVGFLFKERWAIYFGLPAALIGLTDFPLGTLLSCCIFYYLFDIYQMNLHFK